LSGGNRDNLAAILDWLYLGQLQEYVISVNR
jgi:hypothetical protein